MSRTIQLPWDYDRWEPVEPSPATIELSNDDDDAGAEAVYEAGRLAGHAEARAERQAAAAVLAKTQATSAELAQLRGDSIVNLAQDDGVPVTPSAGVQADLDRYIAELELPAVSSSGVTDDELRRGREMAQRLADQEAGGHPKTTSYAGVPTAEETVGDVFDRLYPSDERRQTMADRMAAQDGISSRSIGGLEGEQRKRKPTIVVDPVNR